MRRRRLDLAGLVSRRKRIAFTGIDMSIDVIAADGTGLSRLGSNTGLGRHPRRRS